MQKPESKWCYVTSCFSSEIESPEGITWKGPWCSKRLKVVLVIFRTACLLNCLATGEFQGRSTDEACGERQMVLKWSKEENSSSRCKRESGLNKGGSYSICFGLAVQIDLCFSKNSGINSLYLCSGMRWTMGLWTVFGLLFFSLKLCISHFLQDIHMCMWSFFPCMTLGIYLND